MAKDKPARGLAAKAYAVAGGKISPPSGTGHTGKLVQFSNDAGTTVTDADGWYVYSTTNVSSPVSYVTVTGFPKTGYSKMMIEVVNLKHSDATARAISFAFLRDVSWITVLTSTVTSSQYATGGAVLENYAGDSGVLDFGVTPQSTDAAGIAVTTITSSTVAALKHTGGIDGIRVGFNGFANIDSGTVVVKLR